MSNNNSKIPFMLMILDGFGISDSSSSNAIKDANTPVWDALWEKSPHTIINASEQFVGLPDGQMGNSEVGHMHIGCGRKIEQDFLRISKSIESGEFRENKHVKEMLELAQQPDKKLHVMGLLSPGGVHSHESQILGLVQMAIDAGCENLCVHAFLDGRDTPPRSAKASLEKLHALLSESGSGQIASISGRYYAMDRDKRWDRIALATRLLLQGEAKYTADDPLQALEMAYDRDESDEFVYPTQIKSEHDGVIRAGDPIVFMNFRADRARQLSEKLVEQGMKLYTLTQYDDDLDAQVLFEPQSFKNSLGEYISSLNKTQLRIAETEKYAHVTFFFNGGSEEQYAGEERILVQSPDVATYDLKPEMSAYEVTDKLVAAIQEQKYDLIVVNYANADMVGHTGDFEASVKAVEALDECIGKVQDALNSVNGHCLLTADHGNIEKMYDEESGQAHTAHTCEPVPLVYFGPRQELKFTRDDGTLADVAPTLLHLMELDIPEEMSGRVLCE